MPFLFKTPSVQFLKNFLTARAFTRGFFIALTTASLIACGSSQTPEQILDRAKEFIEKDDLESAVIELKNALVQTPEKLEPRWLLAQTYLKMGNGPSAEKEILKALALGLTKASAAVSLTHALFLQAKYQQAIDMPVEFDGLSNSAKAKLLALRGDSHYKLGELDAAEKSYNSAFSISEDVPEVQIGKARIEFARNHFNEARDQIAEVLKNNPEFAPAWSLLGDIERYENKAQAAENAYSKAISFQHNNLVDVLNRALVRIYTQNYEGAAKDLENLKKRAKNQPWVSYVQGILNFAQDQYAEAETAFLESLNKDPNFSPAVFYLGFSYYMQGQTAQSELYLGRFLSTHPDSDPTSLLLATIRTSQGDYTSAQSLLEPVLVRSPDDAAALNLMANIKLKRGQGEETTQYLRRVVELQPDSATAYMRLGIGLLSEKEDKKALQSFEKASELDPSIQTPELLGIITLLQAKKFDEAIESAQLLSDKHPNNPHPITLMGGAYLGKGDEVSAKKAFERALTVAPDDVAATQNLAKLETRNGNIQGARNLYQQLLKHRPTHLITLLALAGLENNEGNTEEAKQHLVTAIKSHPGVLQPRIQLAGIYLRSGEPASVLALFQNVPEDQAENPFILGAVGEAQLAIGQFQSAITTFQRLVQALPGSARAHFLLAQGYSATGQFGEASGELEKVQAIEPDNLPSKTMMIRILRLSNRQEEAIKLLNKLNPAQSNSLDVLIETGWLGMYQGDLEKAIQAFEEAYEQTPSSDIVFGLGAAFWQSGKPEKSIAIYSEWLTKNPRDSKVWFSLANGYLLLGKTEEAINAYEKVIEHYPNDSIALNNLAWLSRSSDFDKALKYAKRSVELSPNWAGANDTLGMLLLEKGDYAEALRAFQTASQHEPNNLELRYHEALAWVRLADTEKARKILETILTDQSIPFKSRQDAVALLSTLSPRN